MHLVSISLWIRNWHETGREEFKMIKNLKKASTKALQSYLESERYNVCDDQSYAIGLELRRRKNKPFTPPEKGCTADPVP